MRISKRHVTLITYLGPICLVMFLFYGGALLALVVQSFRMYLPGSLELGPLTFENYLEYFGQTFVYYGFLWDTLKIAGVATIISVVMGYPLAYKIIRTKSLLIKKTLLATLVTAFFVNGIVKIYAWIVVLGNSGLVNSILKLAGRSEIRFLGTEGAVVIGLVYFLSPVAAIALIGPIKNVDMTLEEASMNLGASKTRTFLNVTLPLSMPGIVAATLLAYALGVSAFLIPMFLGSGLINFMSNIIYARYSETFNFPGGSALAVVLLVTTLVIAYGINGVLTKRLKGFG